MDTAETSSASSDESNKEKRFVCNIEGCLKKFAKNSKLLSHLRLHRHERPYICDVPSCSQQYTNSSHLRRHKKLKHKDYCNEKIICTVSECGRELASKYNLKKHILRCHNPQRVYPFRCVECQQGFYRKNQLQQHSYLHTGNLPFGCVQCNAKFMTIRDRNRHKRTHKKYSCECGEIYERWTSLLGHKKVCKLKSIKCSICENQFSTKTNLKIHMQTHLDKGERDIFMCPHDECDRYYFYKTNLTVHVNKFHEKIPRAKIPCRHKGCNKLLSKMQNYEVHMRTHEERNRPKFPRKPRKDKGVIRKTALEELCGIKLLNTEDNNKIGGQLDVKIQPSLSNSQNVRCIDIEQINVPKETLIEFYN